jgi:hypothetical protein
LISKYAACSGPGAVGFLDTAVNDMTKKLKVLLHLHVLWVGTTIFKARVAGRSAVTEREWQKRHWLFTFWIWQSIFSAG